MGLAAERSAAEISPAAAAQRKTALRNRAGIRIIMVLPPKLPLACVVFPGTWQATGSAAAHSMDSFRLAPGDPRWRYRAPAISRDSWRAGGSLDSRVAAWRISGRKPEDRKSTRLNSSHANISYAVFCLKKKKKKQLHTVH